MAAATGDADLPAYRGLGFVDDARLRARLLQVRERRELGIHWWATGELAVVGDADARAELLQAFADGRYGVVNAADASARTLGFDLATVPELIDELESQCCRVVTSGAGNVLREPFAFEACETVYRTEYDQMRAHWDRHDGRFVWSDAGGRVGGRFEPAPR